MYCVLQAACAAALAAPGAAPVPATGLPTTPVLANPVLARVDLGPIEPDEGVNYLVGPAPPAPSVQSEPIVRRDARIDGEGTSFGDRAKSVKWELVGALAVLTFTNVRSIAGETQGFRFVEEGFFGRDTGQLGLDKLAHSWNSYVFTDILYKRMARKVGGGRRTAWTSAALGMGLQTYGEIYDGFHRGSGFSWEDMGFNALGIGFSMVRHAVPSVADRVDFRTYFVPPNRPEGLGDPDRFEKQRFLLALKGSGFAGVRDTPLRFAELHLGYRAKNFSVTDRRVGLTPERRIFVGVGFNVAELFKRRTGPVASVARSTLEYVQLPYTSAHVDLTR